ncbi:unnamed protein product, partial [Didymodactylos carnosus]
QRINQQSIKMKKSSKKLSSDTRLKDGSSKNYNNNSNIVIEQQQLSDRKPDVIPSSSSKNKIKPSQSMTFMSVDNQQMWNNSDVPSQSLFQSPVVYPIFPNYPYCYQQQQQTLISREISLEELNNHISELIVRIHTNRRYVSIDNLEHELFIYYQVHEWKQLNKELENKPYSPKLKNLFNLKQKLKKIKTFLQALQTLNTLCTLYELDEILGKLFNKQKYDDLTLGPLKENVDICSFFNFPHGCEIPPITSVDVYGYLYNYMLCCNWNPQIDFNAFEVGLQYQYNVRELGEVGIRVTSWPFLVENLNFVGRNVWQRQNHQLEQYLYIKFNEMICEIKDNFKHTLEDINLKQRYVHKSCSSVLDDLIMIIRNYIFFNEQYQLLELMELFKQNKLYECLLNFAILLGSYETPDNLMSQLQQIYSQQQHIPIYPTNISTIQPSMDQQSISPHQPYLQEQQQYQNRCRELCRQISEIICKTDGILTIQNLLFIEDELCSKYQLNDFTEFNCGDFLKFFNLHRENIDQHLELYLYQPDSGIKCSDLLRFVNKFLDYTKEDQNDHHLNLIEKAVLHKFKIYDLKSIGFSSMKQLCEKIKQQYDKPMQTIVQYEEVLLSDECLQGIDVGIHCSSITNCDHLCKYLLTCPILTDLSLYSHWNRLYLQQYGQLKEFLIRNDYKMPEMKCLELTNGVLIRLIYNPNIKQFEEDLSNQNLKQAACQLLSLAVEETQLPLQPIIQTIIYTWFLDLRSKMITENQNIHKPFQLILEFLFYLPCLFTITIFRPLILSKLDEVFRDTEQLKILWDLTEDNQQQRMYLEEIGLALGIYEWTQKLCLNIEQLQLKENQQTLTMVTVTSTSSSTNHDDNQKQFEIKDENSKTVAFSSPSSKVSIPDSSKNITVELGQDDAISAKSEVSSAYQHIDEIRCSKFGENLALDTNSQPLVQHLQGILERALDKLANDLYSEQTHFVLELLQNADDNLYLLIQLSQSDVPKVKFIISKTAIILCNNEDGFTKINMGEYGVSVRSSDKHKQGYLGHKGIGFKSVFIVTDRPEIHSNGYHVCFDATVGQIGYIKPTWLSVYNPLPNDGTSWTTYIRLNLKPEIQDSLESKFGDIQSPLLLFLNRLKEIEIVYSDKQCSKVKPRDTKSDIVSTDVCCAFPLDGLTQQQQQQQSLRIQPVYAYLPLRHYGFRFVLQADFEIPANRQEIMRDNIWNDVLKSGMSDLLLMAYEQFEKLPEIIQQLNLNNTNNIDLIQVFKYFLKFIPYNKNGIDPYFHSFVENTMKVLITKLKFPIESCSLTNKIEWFPSSKCIYVKDVLIRKVLPSELLSKHLDRYYLHQQLNDLDENLLYKFGIQKLNTQEILHIINELFSNEQHTINTCSIEQIAQWLLCIDYCLHNSEQHATINDDYRRTCEKLRHLKILPIHKQLKLVSISEMTIFFPVKDNILQKFSNHMRYLYEDLTILNNDLLLYVQKHYSFRYESFLQLLKELGIHDNDTSDLNEIYDKHICTVLKNENLWKQKLESVLVSYLVCIYDYLYMTQNRSEKNRRKFDMKELKSFVQIKTQKKEFYNPQETVIHLTAKYGSNCRLDEIKIKDWLFISDDYFDFISEKLLPQFKLFLEELGIYDSFKIDIRERYFSSITELRGTQWERFEEELLSLIVHDQEFSLIDYECLELNSLLEMESTTQNFTQLKYESYSSLLTCLNQCWHQIKRFLNIQISLNQNTSKSRLQDCKDIDSTFCSVLKQSNWIPANFIQRKYNELTKQIEMEKLKLVCKPTEVFIHLKTDSSLQKCFKDYFPYIEDNNLKGPFREKIGLHDKCSQEDMMKVLLHWSNPEQTSLKVDASFLQTSTDDKRKILEEQLLYPPCRYNGYSGPIFISTLEHMNNLYSYVSELLKIYSEKLSEFPFVFVPQENLYCLNDIPQEQFDEPQHAQKIKSTWCIGEFLYLDEVYWTDPTNLFNKYSKNSSRQQRSLDIYYNELENLFKYTLNISRAPKSKDYYPLLFELIESIKTRSSNTYDEDLNDIWKIYETFALHTTVIVTAHDQSSYINQQIAKEIINTLNNHDCIPIMEKSVFVKILDQPLIPDDDEIARLFMDDSFIPLIQLPDNSPTIKWRPFCEMCRFENLTSYVQSFVYISDFHHQKEYCLHLYEFFSSTIIYIQIYLYTRMKELTRTFDKLDLYKKFQSMTFWLVDHLEVHYVYKKDSSIEAKRKYDAYIDDNKFYLLKKYKESNRKFIDAMVNFLIPLNKREFNVERRRLADFIYELYDEYQHDQIQEYLIKINLPLDLPSSGVRQWKIEKYMTTTECEINTITTNDNNESTNLDQNLIRKLNEESLLLKRSSVQSVNLKQRTDVENDKTASLQVLLTTVVTDMPLSVLPLVNTITNISEQLLETSNQQQSQVPRTDEQSNLSTSSRRKKPEKRKNAKQKQLVETESSNVSSSTEVSTTGRSKHKHMTPENRKSKGDQDDGK